MKRKEYKLKMTKDVLVTLHSLQFDKSAENDVAADAGISDAGMADTAVYGLYYEKSGSRYVLFDEKIEGIEKPVKTRLKFGRDFLELSRSGAVNVRMLFEKNKRNMSSYNTPYGSILLGIYTKRIDISDSPDEITVSIDYTLEAGNEHLSDCGIAIKIQPGSFT